MKISHHGHSVVRIETNGTVILIDPFITGNSQCDLNAEDVKADVIIVTHGHDDHVGDTVRIAQRNNALIVGNFELVTQLRWWGVERTQNICSGGSHTFDFGEIKFTFALHSGSGFVLEDEQRFVYMGNPSGVLFTAEGKTIYHAGDTGLFGDMKLIGELNDIDVAFLPIGDHFAMGPKDAAIAAKMLKAKRVVPIHHSLIPILEQDPEDFIRMLDPGVGIILNAGEELTI